MNVLFVTARLPYPPHSGATIRTYNLIRRMARKHEIHLVAYADARREAQSIEFLNDHCASVTTVPWREVKGTPYFYLELLLNLLSSKPYLISRFTKPAMGEAIRRLLEAKRTDLIFCDFPFLSLNFPSPKGRPSIVTAHDVETILWRRYLAQEQNPLKRFYLYLQYRKVARFESRLLGEFQHVVCMSNDDLERLKALCPSQRYTVVPNGVDLEYFAPMAGPKVEYRLVYTGAMDMATNQDAARFFLSQVYPRIKQAEPRTSFVIVGRQPPPAIYDLASRYKDVTVVGTVPDIRPHLASGSVYVVPLRIGGGTRLKILEAMAMGQPVVSTSVGCEGLRVIPGHHLLVADQPDAFAENVVRLFRNPAVAARIGQAGHRLVHEAYGWDSIAGTLDQVLTNTAAQGAA